MFQNNTVSQPLSLWLKKQESNSSYSATIQVNNTQMQAKSTIKVNIPIQDEYQFTQINNVDRIDKASQDLVKFKDYIQFHAIEPSDIWQHKESLQYLVFVDVIQKKLGYKFSTTEILALKVISQNNNLSLNSFNRISLWPKKENSKASLLTGLSQKSFFDMKKKGSSSAKNIIKFQVRKSQQHSFVDLRKFHTNKREKAKMRTTCDQLTNNLLKSRFNEQVSKDNKIQALREDMEMNALQKKWQLVVMAGEMNKWIYDSQSETEKQNKQIPPLFKIVNLGQNFTIVRVDQQKQQQIIPQVVFYKKYHALKKKQSSNKQIEKKTVNQAILGILNMSSSKSPVNKFNQRDKQLNESLLHIMRIKNILQHQHKLLTQSAINT